MNWKKLLLEVLKVVLAMLLGEAIEPIASTTGEDIEVVEAIGLGAATLIGAGASLLGTAGSAVSQGKLNRKTRKWNEKMWNLQNQYNLPSNQMARFKEAGLNPNLIYGQGNSGNSGTPPSWSPDAPKFDGVGTAVGKGIQAALAQGQVEKLRLENAILDTALQDNNIDLDVKKRMQNFMGSDGTIGGEVTSRNMLLDERMAVAQSKMSQAQIDKVTEHVSRMTRESRIDQVAAQAVNEAARTGLISQQEAESISRQDLQKLEAAMKKYEVDFIRDFNIKKTDLAGMAKFLLQVILNRK